MSRLFSQHFNFRTWTRSNSFLGVLSIVASVFAGLPIRLHLIDLLFKYFSSSFFSKRRRKDLFSIDRQEVTAARNVWRNPCGQRSFNFVAFYLSLSSTDEGTPMICFSKIDLSWWVFFSINIPARAAPCFSLLTNSSFARLKFNSLEIDLS